MKKDRNGQPNNILNSIIGEIIKPTKEEKQAAKKKKKKKCQIKSYFHCRTCLSQDKGDLIAVGLTKCGDIQVWCDNCNQQVCYLSREEGEEIT